MSGAQERRKNQSSGRPRPNPIERDALPPAAQLGLPLRVRHKRQRPLQPVLRGLASGAGLHRHHVRERDEVVRHGALSEQGGLLQGRRHARPRQAPRPRRPRPQRVLGRPALPALVGPAPPQPGALSRGPEAARLRRVAVQGPARRVGRGQREHAQPVLRGQAGERRLGELLQLGFRGRSRDDDVSERVQHDRESRRRGGFAGEVRGEGERDSAVSGEWEREVGDWARSSFRKQSSESWIYQVVY